jgi:DNA invertase Pin-like site-specific DNA recombinase
MGRTDTEERPTTDADAYRKQLLEHLPTLNLAAEQVVASITNARQAYEAVRELLITGTELQVLVDDLQPGELRGDLSHSLAQLEHARHNTQCVLFRLLQAEGMTITDIARAWGISRQLVSRLINEPTRTQ